MQRSLFFHSAKGVEELRGECGSICAEPLLSPSVTQILSPVLTTASTAARHNIRILYGPAPAPACFHSDPVLPSWLVFSLRDSRRILCVTDCMWDFCMRYIRRKVTVGFGKAMVSISVYWFPPLPFVSSLFPYDIPRFSIPLWSLKVLNPSRCVYINRLLVYGWMECSFNYTERNISNGTRGSRKYSTILIFHGEFFPDNLEFGNGRCVGITFYPMQVTAYGT